jgi:hypothetical protein
MTGCRSVGELAITRRISAVAVCCSSVSLRSRFLASSSLNRRTFSIAITAWAANVLQELDLLRWESDLAAAHHDRSDGPSLPQHGDS